MYYQPLGKHVVQQTLDSLLNCTIHYTDVTFPIYLFLFSKCKNTQVGVLPHTMGQNAFLQGQNAHGGRFAPSATSHNNTLSMTLG